MPTVTLGGKTLSSGTDYTLSYSNNTNVGTATVTVTGKGNYTGTKTANFDIAIPFVDVTMSTPHVADVCWLAEQGISTGWNMGDGSREFRPTNTVIRQDMAAFLFRLAERWGIVDETWQPSGSVTFSDVNPSTPHYREIMWLAESEVSTGWGMPDGSREFRPTENVIRQDMAAFLFRMQALRDWTLFWWQPYNSDIFADVNTGTPHYREIMWLATSGVSTGWPMQDFGREFRPTNTVIRQDMAAFLRRLDAVESEG